jgi:tryptophanyl-tRNA synthetase
MTRKIVLSGSRPTGNIHLGNYFGAIVNWVRLQEDYDCYFFIADWHALTTGYADTSKYRENVYGVMADFIACGLDPDRSTIFMQSSMKEHAELYLLLGMVTPLAWLERCPTYKDMIAQMGDRDIANYGFLGYPCLQAADILMYQADFVPVGEDQLPHLELTREIARRFNHLYEPVFPEPQPMLTTAKLLPGTDGRKMSKSYGNTIAFADTPLEAGKKIMGMITDPARIRRDDPGHPEICSVFAYQKVFAPETVEALQTDCMAGKIGCVQCKRMLQERFSAFHAPIHQKRTALLTDLPHLKALLENGAEKARPACAKTMERVRQAMRIDV